MLERDPVAGSYVLRGASAADGIFRKRPDGTFGSPEDANAQLTENPDGTVTIAFLDTGETWSFDATAPAHRLLSTSRAGYTVIGVYGPDGIADLSDDQGNVARFSYDANGDVSEIADQDEGVHDTSTTANGGWCGTSTRPVPSRATSMTVSGA